NSRQAFFRYQFSVTFFRPSNSRSIFWSANFRSKNRSETESKNHLSTGVSDNLSILCGNLSGFFTLEQYQRQCPGGITVVPLNRLGRVVGNRTLATPALGENLRGTVVVVLLGGGDVHFSPPQSGRWSGHDG